MKDAQAFQKRHKISTVKFLWDKTGKSWSALGVPAQPAWALLSPQGEILAADLGQIPYQDVSRVVAALELQGPK